MTIYFIITLLLIIGKCEWIPKIVWTYWDSPFGQDQHFLKAFTENHKRILNNSGWEYRFLNKESVKPWIKDMKEVVEALQRPQFKNQHVTRRANLIRLALISYYGGVWIDYSTCLVSNFDWLYQLKQISMVQNIYGDEPSVFMTYNSYQKQPIKVFDPETSNYFFIDIRLQTSFIATQPNTTFLNEWLRFFIQGKRINEQKLKQGIRLVEDNFIVDTAIKQKVERGSFLGSYFQFQISILIILQRRQRELDKIWEENGRQGFRKLAMKQYKIWVIPFQKSIFFSASITKPQSSDNLISYLFRWEEEYLKQNQLTNFYPIKTVRPTRDQIFAYFDKAASVISFCPQLTYINKDSIFYKYLLKDYPIIFLKNVQLDKYAARLNLGFYCPKVVFDEKRRIQLEYTKNGLGSQIGKVFDGVRDTYYVDIEIEDESTLNLFTNGWRRVDVRSSDKMTISSLFPRETDKFVKLILGEPDNSISPPETTTTLAKFCKEHYETKPKFLNIGQVGVKRMVLHTNDWENLKCRPEVIQIKDIKNQANYLQHEALLLKHDYVLLRDYRLNETEKVSQIFVTKEKQEYYRRHYKQAFERETKNGVVKFSEISKLVEDYFVKYLTEHKIPLKDKAFYHFSRAGEPLVISDIFQNKTANSKQVPVFVFEFDPLSSEVVVNGEYSKSTVSIQYLQFVKLDVKQEGSVLIFDPSSDLVDKIQINSVRTVKIDAKKQSKQDNEQEYKNAFKSLLKKSTQQYYKLNERILFLYCLIMTLCIICIINFLSSIKAKNRLKAFLNNRRVRRQVETISLTQQQSQRKIT